MTPPQHSINASPVYIRIKDPVWDRDRIDLETDAMENEKPPRKHHEHPVMRYFAGETRFDLNAKFMWEGREVTVREWFREGVNPVKFVLRRVGTEGVAEISNALAEGDKSGSYVKAWVLATKLGLTSVDGSDVVEFLTRGGLVHPRTIDQIYDTFDGMKTITQIGTAVWVASQPLSRAEGKH